MDNFWYIENRMKLYADIKNKGHVTEEISNTNISFNEIKQYLVKTGEILEEDVTQGFCLARVYGGTKQKNPAVIGISIDTSKILVSAYAKEGFLNQHTAKRIVEELKEYFNLI